MAIRSTVKPSVKSLVHQCIHVISFEKECRDATYILINVIFTGTEINNSPSISEYS